jgi:hypothetical protein
VSRSRGQARHAAEAIQTTEFVRVLLTGTGSDARHERHAALPRAARHRAHASEVARKRPLWRRPRSQSTSVAHALGAPAVAPLAHSLLGLTLLDFCLDVSFHVAALGLGASSDKWNRSLRWKVILCLAARLCT